MTQRRRIHADLEHLQRLYVDELLTIDETAARLRCSATTVRRMLRRWAVPARSRGARRVEFTPAAFPAWSPDLAYVVGLIATDGNLSLDGRHLTVSSKDAGLLETVRECLNLRARVTPYRSGAGREYHHVQWSDVRLYKWLLRIGLTPAKSRSLGPLAVPDAHFRDFLRGCIDGDGSVVVYPDRYHAAKSARYVYERLSVRLVSASEPFLVWIQDTLRRLIGVHGAIGLRTELGKRPMWWLRYAKRESLVLLQLIYYSPGVPCLQRKLAKAKPFLFSRS